MAKSPPLRVVRSRPNAKGVSAARSEPDADRLTLAGAVPAPGDAQLGAGLLQGADGRLRCWWAGSDPLYARYHDDEWGRPVRNDHRLFEKICLEGFQSGLSWLTILRKREHFREAFDGFDPDRVARYTARDVTRLLKNTGIVRHRGKIESTINNARRALEHHRGARVAGEILLGMGAAGEGAPNGLFDYDVLRAISTTPASVRLSNDLKARGWTFVGPTTVYAFMQAMGLVNDHVEGCPCRLEVAKMRRR